MNTPQPEPRLFHLVRSSGASPEAESRAAAGRVIVADGVEWSDGTVTLRWRGQWPATSVWEGGIDAVLAVHARSGATELHWFPAPKPLPSTTTAPAPPPTGAVDWQALSGLRLAAPGVDGRCVSCGLIWPCLSCGP
ncbi:hypothetical protein [Streptomyces sp. SID13031]|uniref:hypothetical protein n=1 Tax=Streptomyces sp. SID13031 TaxID=2706046 RepID=UPI0013C75562|nr:hypothetical protein [Streptomyces sp. SID13031]NEA33924.1 hypothetical protein [Streptomyces sp. SID13031]